MNRRTALTLRVVIVTSLIWFLVDVFLLMYFTDCTNSREARANDCATVSTGTGKPASLKPTPAVTAGPVVNFFNRIIPDGTTLCEPYHL